MGGSDDNNNIWSWCEKQLQNAKAQHDKLHEDLRSRELESRQRLEKENLPQDKDNRGSNPLSAFKGFVDNTFDVWANRIKNFPANVSELRTNMQQEQERRQAEELDISRRWTGSSDSPDHIHMEAQRLSEDDKEDAYSETLDLLDFASLYNDQVPQNRINALFHDSEKATRLGWDGISGFGDAMTPQWLSINWFKRSPYSPVRLEAHTDMRLAGETWRMAFEDLMNASLGKTMLSFESRGLQHPFSMGSPFSYSSESGLAWVLTLQQHGILPPLLPRFYHSGNQLGDEQNFEKILGSSRGEWHARLGKQTALDSDVRELVDQMSVHRLQIYKTRAISEGDSSHTEVHPETEQDLYDAARSGNAVLKDYREQLEHLGQQNREPLIEARQDHDSSSSDSSSTWRLSGIKEVDLDEAEDRLEHALCHKDVATATAVFNEFYRHYGQVGELIEESALSHEWLKVLNQALRQSDLPDDNPHRQFAFSDYADMEMAGRQSLDEKTHRSKLYDQLKELGFTCNDLHSFVWCTNAALEQYVGRLQQEHDNLMQMVGEKKQEWASQTSAKKPNVLAALTTTQTTRLPDGTVTTKVVLKQKFADGREETHETVHTSHEGTDPQAKQEAEPKKQGWFWS